jgi:hypothetical protein
VIAALLSHLTPQVDGHIQMWDTRQPAAAVIVFPVQQVLKSRLRAVYSAAFKFAHAVSCAARSTACKRSSNIRVSKQHLTNTPNINPEYQFHLTRYQASSPAAAAAAAAADVNAISFLSSAAFVTAHDDGFCR